MTPDTDSSFEHASTAPVALPAALRARVLAAMQQAADEEQGYREVEQMLRRFRPAPVPSRLVASVQQAVDEEYSCLEMAQMLRRFRPAPVPSRLVAAMQQAVDEEYSRLEMAQMLRQFRPAPVPSRLVASVQQAVDEEYSNLEMEQMLRRFRPASLPFRLVGRLGVAIEKAKNEEENPVVTRPTGKDKSLLWYLSRGGVAAAIVAFVVAGGMMLGTGSAVAEDENQSLVSRNIIESRSADHVEWRRGDAPVRHYTVVYEDAFVMDAEETTTVIRVPNTTKVEVEEDYL